MPAEPLADNLILGQKAPGQPCRRLRRPQRSRLQSPPVGRNAVTGTGAGGVKN